MRASRWATAAVMFCAATASAEVTPQPVDLKPIRDKLLVFADSAKGFYVLYLGDGKSPERRLFYGTGKTLYEQRIIGYSRNGQQWSLSTWAPRIAEMRPGSFEQKSDGTYLKSCDGKDDHVLTLLTGDKAKAVLDGMPVMTEMLVQRPHLLARDDAGVYYYVDRLAERYGGKGYRVFVGKKGAMKQMDLTDLAADSGGEVFSTKTGDLRLTRTASADGGNKATWIRGDKREELVTLNVDVNSPLIFRDLGVYKFTGTICDNI
ncbi:MAG: hypothetical protein KF773_34260 [Deltaproteobacteria bacterium]|nr:hypothetical protein [Deltaproteobacteria bacterium]MCW5807128.1 hypothetical protein [Deltaproteobacteria bacterium]